MVNINFSLPSFASVRYIKTMQIETETHIETIEQAIRLLRGHL